MRKVSKVHYSFSDIVPTGEFNGRYHTHGVSVYMTNELNQRLIWNTTIPPTKHNSVEKYTDTPVSISYEEVSENSSGHIIVKNVRFLKEK